MVATCNRLDKHYLSYDQAEKISEVKNWKARAGEMYYSTSQSVK